MSYRKFGKNDVLINTVKAHPRSEFYIHTSSVYYNNRSRQQGQYSGDARVVGSGFISLYEYNIDKGASGISYDASAVAAAGGFTGPGTNLYIEPYISKDSSRISLTMTTASLTFSEWGGEFGYGDKITGSYPQYATIKREFITTPSASSEDCGKKNLDCGHNYSYMSLRPLLNHYGTLSEHYKVSSSYGNKDSQELNLIHIPSIFYGNRIKPGTVSLRWYVTGTLVAEIADLKQNGELISTNKGTATGSAYGPGLSTMGINLSDRSGSVQGVVFYNEGFIMLTGSVPITQNYALSLRASADKDWPQWKYWGVGTRDGITESSFAAADRSSFRSASFGLSFQGETTTETVTLYARAKKGEVNYSNNPTFIKHNQQLLNFTSSHIYEENKERLLKNIVTSSFGDYEEKFRRQVYISKIGVYDEQKNLIGIATLADPVLKDENEDYVFKIKTDM